MENDKVEMMKDSWGQGYTLSNPSDPCNPWMHIKKIEIFDRPEDAEKVQVITYEKEGKCSIQTKNNAATNNPSDRRDGLVIHFEPENGYPINLNIAQHKGEILVSWSASAKENKQKIKLQPEKEFLNYFVEYKFNGGIATANGSVREIKKTLDQDIGEGRYTLNG